MSREQVQHVHITSVCVYRHRGNSRQSGRAREGREPPDFPETTLEAREAAQHAAEALADDLNAKAGSTIAAAKVSWHIPHLLVCPLVYCVCRDFIMACRHVETDVAATIGSSPGESDCHQQVMVSRKTSICCCMFAVEQSRILGCCMGPVASMHTTLACRTACVISVQAASFPHSVLYTASLLYAEGTYSQHSS